MLEVIFGVDSMSLAQLEELKAELCREQDAWRARSRQASGCIVRKGAGRRSAQVQVRSVPGRRNPKVLAEADVALRRLSRLLASIEKELARRAAGGAAARA